MTKVKKMMVTFAWIVVEHEPPPPYWRPRRCFVCGTLLDEWAVATYLCGKQKKKLPAKNAATRTEWSDKQARLTFHKHELVAKWIESQQTKTLTSGSRWCSSSLLRFHRHLNMVAKQSRFLFCSVDASPSHNSLLVPFFFVQDKAKG